MLSCSWALFWLRTWVRILPGRYGILSLRFTPATIVLGGWGHPPHRKHLYLVPRTRLSAQFNYTSEHRWAACHGDRGRSTHALATEGFDFSLLLLPSLWPRAPGAHAISHISRIRPRPARPSANSMHRLSLCLCPFHPSAAKQGGRARVARMYIWVHVVFQYTRVPSPRSNSMHDRLPRQPSVT
ncbi:hypothetical protein BV25DRAFT_1323143 [Artomyces pyxidatus]|uniref:Uncharacterized protein n=1 Tax=Artomyces pyxidatus TaxID=48021 RepID=A0ACB8SQF1_9AGAM|nr:hypothetical protein BV25DRAFT_1323143 [Artomyces pyxidatus]